MSEIWQYDQLDSLDHMCYTFFPIFGKNYI